MCPLLWVHYTPEYLFPSNAMRIAGLYGEKLKNVKVAFDLNSNCTGMVQGLDIVYKYMQASDLKRALVVGCFCITPIALWSDTVVYATFADAAACVALGMDESSEKRGFIDTIVSVDASYHDYIKYPKCGMAKVPLQAVMPNEKKIGMESVSYGFYSRSMDKRNNSDIREKFA